MSVWFDGSIDIDCTLRQVKDAFEDYGEHYAGVVTLMPGLSTVELVNQGNGSVEIRTNEGLMKRTSIDKRIAAESVVVEFDEEYQAGSGITTTSHIVEEFTTSDAGVALRTVIRDLKAPGLLGFFYRHFGSNNIGNAFLKSHKSYLERQRD